MKIAVAALAERFDDRDVIKSFASVATHLSLHPNKTTPAIQTQNNLPQRYWQSIIIVLKNYRNWSDCFLIIFLDSPFTILGTLWGIVTLTNFYHFTSSISALIIMLMFAGSIIGSLSYGILSDRYQRNTELVACSTGLIFLLCLAIIYLPHPNDIRAPSGTGQARGRRTT